jgi:Fe-S oxidoreductase
MGISNAGDTIRACRYCFMCRFSCPTFLATKRESVTPRGYALLLSRIEKRSLEWSEDVLSAFYRCSLCGLGREHCEYGWPEDEMIRQARAEIASLNLAPPSVQTAARKLINNEKGWRALDSLPSAQANPDVLYLAGCQARERHPEIIAASARVFQASGVKWGVLSEEGCCGGGLYDLGLFAEARAKAEELGVRIRSLNPRMIVTGCAHCFRTFKEFYPAWGVTLPADSRVLHMTEFMSLMVREGSLALDGMLEDGKWGYHDPCMLGRKMGVYAAPRELLQLLSGRAPIELSHSREKAECCGAGSVTVQVEAATAFSVARRRLEKAGEAGVRTLVTACQNCKTVFEEAAPEGKVRILDLVELVAGHLK